MSGGQDSIGAPGTEAAVPGDAANPSAAVARESEAGPTTDEEMVDAVYGNLPPDEVGLLSQAVLKTRFSPWHHPVKQLVREYQWAELTRKLIERERPAERRGVLRYFTLPGADLLDVRVLAEALQAAGTRIAYFGFDIGYRDAADASEAAEQTAVYFATESALRQAGRITDDAEILNDRLEDIARSGSQAANRLGQKAVFDVINIDACDHLGFVPQGRTNSVFDALESLLAHQLKATHPWLLFVTTRASPAHLGPPAAKLQGAIHSNLGLHAEAFGTALAACIEGQLKTIAADIVANWATPSLNFLKLFCVGLGKYLLQFFHAQHNLPADVELASAFAYKVHDAQPDMVSLAFRIKPRGLRVQPPTAGAASVTEALELKRAVDVTERARKLWDLDAAILDDSEARNDAVNGTAKLLRSADYDLESWRLWLAALPFRPMVLEDVRA